MKKYYIVKLKDAQNHESSDFVLAETQEQAESVYAGKYADVTAVQIGEDWAREIRRMRYPIREV